jgi:hypothetical protein
MSKVLYEPDTQVYEVPSESRKDKKHIVQITERQEAQCSCEDWQLNADPRYRCKHIRRVLAQRKAKR